MTDTTTAAAPDAITQPRMCEDTVVREVVQKFEARSEVGRHKYGTTLDRDDLTTEQWIVHAQEELMDATLYLQRLLRKLQDVRAGKLQSAQVTAPPQLNPISNE